MEGYSNGIDGINERHNETVVPTSLKPNLNVNISLLIITRMQDRQIVPESPSSDAFVYKDIFD
jgi:hypothetical protein